MQTFGDAGRQQAQDCTFQAGKIQGAPLKIHYFLVIFFEIQNVVCL